jgi:hypothetical protein
MASYLFLDVDGVLNPETSFADDLDPTFKVHRIGKYDVWVSRKQGEWLQGLRKRGVNIVWATTWIESPPMLDELADLLGLPLDLDRIDVMDYTSYKDCGKQPGIFRWLNKNNIDPDLHPCVWVDDLLGPNDKLWAKVLGIKAVHVNPAHGLANKSVISRIERGLKDDEA